MENLLYSFFKNMRFTMMMQCLSAIVFSLVLVSFSWGPIFFIMYVILWEILMIAFNSLCESPYWTIESRLYIVYSSIFGYLIGRTLLLEDPFAILPLLFSQEKILVYYNTNQEKEKNC